MFNDVYFLKRNNQHSVPHIASDPLEFCDICMYGYTTRMYDIHNTLLSVTSISFWQTKATTKLSLSASLGKGTHMFMMIPIEITNFEEIRKHLEHSTCREQIYVVSHTMNFVILANCFTWNGTTSRSHWHFSEIHFNS